MPSCTPNFTYASEGQGVAGIRGAPGKRIVNGSGRCVGSERVGGGRGVVRIAPSRLLARWRGSCDGELQEFVGPGGGVVSADGVSGCGCSCEPDCVGTERSVLAQDGACWHRAERVGTGRSVLAQGGACWHRAGRGGDCVVAIAGVMARELRWGRCVEYGVEPGCAAGAWRWRQAAGLHA
jgi:hypothetical protein